MDPEMHSFLQTFSIFKISTSRELLQITPTCTTLITQQNTFFESTKVNNIKNIAKLKFRVNLI